MQAESPINKSTQADGKGPSNNRHHHIISCYYPVSIEGFIPTACTTITITTTMSDVRIIPQQEIQHAALEHEIRTLQTRTELERSHKKSASLDTYRAELLEKVHQHLDELHHLEESRERTGQFKEEMLAKVNEHLAELEMENAKKEEVAKIKEELLDKVHRHAEELERVYAKRADLETYKSELLAKAEEHMRDVELAHEKEAQVRRFSMEMKQKYVEKYMQHEAHLAERANVEESLKKEIVNEAKSYLASV
jgi:hypothetical protein